MEQSEVVRLGHLVSHEVATKTVQGSRTVSGMRFLSLFLFPYLALNSAFTSDGHGVARIIFLYEFSKLLWRGVISDEMVSLGIQTHVSQ